MVSSISLFLVLGGGAAFATHETILSSDIVDGEVQNPDLGTDAVTTSKIRNGEVANADIAPNAITATRLAADSVETSEIRNNNVFNADIAAGTITSSRVADGTLTEADVDEDKLKGPKVDIGSTRGTPADPPENTLLQTQITTTMSGNLLVFGEFDTIQFSCPPNQDCDAHVGLYVDGSPVPGTSLFRTVLCLASASHCHRLVETPYLVGIKASVPAATHTIALGETSVPGIENFGNGFVNTSGSWSLGGMPVR